MTRAEMMNRTLVAAHAARQEGFSNTEEALLEIARDITLEIRQKVDQSVVSAENTTVTLTKHEIRYYN